MNNNEVDRPTQSDAPLEEGSETVAPPSKPNRARQFFQRLLRWVFGILIIFGLGFLLAIFTLYIPNRQAIDRKDASLRQVNQKVEDLQSELVTLKDEQKTCQNVQDELENANLHVVILKAQIDVANAQLAMANNAPEKARLSLSEVENTLQTIARLVVKNQQKIISDLQSRLSLAIGEVNTNPYAAQSDLDVLATGLLELENASFASP
jgi:hypothetical protein